MRFQAPLPFVLGAVVVLNVAMRDCLGSYSPVSFVLTIVSLILALIACLMGDWFRTVAKSKHKQGMRDGNMIFMAVTCLLFSAIGTTSTITAFADDHVFVRASNCSAIAGLALCLVFGFRIARHREGDNRISRRF